MLQTEFIRSLQSNYERVYLQQKPDEKKYQYCILTRGGIRGLLPCSLRYINGQVYLYYDITSRQNVAQLYGKETIDRDWVRNFFWSYAQVRQELGRFLLDEKNILVFPEQIFQDLGNRNFFFLYLPYNEEENGFSELFDFLIERIDYNDDRLVECVYKMYEQYDQGKEIYLQEKLLQDAALLEAEDRSNAEERQEERNDLKLSEQEDETAQTSMVSSTYPDVQKTEKTEKADKMEKKGIFGLWGSKKKKDAERRKNYYDMMTDAMEGRAVAEETVYGAQEYEEQEYGKTVYMETAPEEVCHKLYTPDGRVAANLKKESFIIGKQKGEVDLVLEDESVSRMHARIFAEDQVLYLEDLNSTNGTFKNGLRMQPYEKRRLEEGDEIKVGKLLFIFR